MRFRGNKASSRPGKGQLGRGVVLSYSPLIFLTGSGFTERRPPPPYYQSGRSGWKGGGVQAWRRALTGQPIGANTRSVLVGHSTLLQIFLHYNWRPMFPPPVSGTGLI